MTPKDTAITAAERRKKVDDAHVRALEHVKNSPHGMRLTAQGLRDRARNMPDAGDRATMLHLASEYERRATALDLLRARIAK